MLEAVQQDLSVWYSALNSCQAVQAGGTQFGLSRDRKALQCGMQAVLDGFRAAGRNYSYPQQTFNAAGKPAVIGARAGSAFHGFQELWTLGQLKWTPIPENVKDEDMSLAAALTAFRRYAGENVGSPHYLGNRKAVEFPINGTLAHYERTGRIDAVVDADAEHIDRWGQYGIYDAEPGTYLWDYKLLSAVSADDIGDYRRDLQLMAYMLMYEQMTGVRPAGAVYELVSRAAKPTLSRLLVLVPNLPENKQIVEWAVAEAEASRIRGACAPGNACRGTYGPCPHREVCPLYGTFNQHSDTLSNYVQRLAMSQDGVEE